MFVSNNEENSNVGNIISE